MTDRESLRSRFKQTAAQTWRPPAAPTQPGTGGLRLPPRATAPELRRTDLLAVKSRLHAAVSGFAKRWEEVVEEQKASEDRIRGAWRDQA